MKHIVYIIFVVIGYLGGIYTPLALGVQSINKKLKTAAEHYKMVDGIGTKQNSIIKNMNLIVRDLQKLEKQFKKIRPNKSVIVEIKEVKNE